LPKNTAGITGTGTEGTATADINMTADGKRLPGA